MLSLSNELLGRTNLGFAEYNIRITILRLVHIGRRDHKQELLEFHERLMRQVEGSDVHFLVA